MAGYALVFPGQGAQCTGMGREIYEAIPEFRETFELGSKILGRDIAELCFKTTEDMLSRTENAQLALFSVSMATFAAMKTAPKAMAGFSLGECSAICASGILSLEDGFRLVAERSRLMQEAADSGGGAMSAVLGLDGDKIELLSSGVDAVPVNFNCPGQVVVAGTPEGVETLEKLCLKSGAKRAVRLKLSGAFHTEAMRAAANKLEEYARSLKWHRPATLVYSNATGLPLDLIEDLPSHLAYQMTHPVLWQASIENMLGSGINAFIEVGQGRTLGQFIVKTDKTARVFRTDSLESFRQAAAYMEENT